MRISGSIFIIDSSFTHDYFRAIYLKHSYILIKSDKFHYDLFSHSAAKIQWVGNTLMGFDGF